MRRSVLRFQLLFLLFLGGLIALSRTPFVLEGLRDPLCAGLAESVAAVLAVFGVPTHASDAVVHAPGGGIRVVYDCDGIALMCFFLAAALAFPKQSRRRAAVGIVAGLLVIHAANLLRLTLLTWIYLSQRSLFEFAHVYVFQAFVVLVTLATWLAWASHARRPTLPGPEPA